MHAQKQGGTMNKLKLIDALKKECRISKKEASAIVDLFFRSMSDALVRGERVEIRGQ
jgi:integration host factor subunit beta